MPFPWDLCGVTQFANGKYSGERKRGGMELSRIEKKIMPSMDDSKTTWQISGNFLKMSNKVVLYIVSKCNHQLGSGTWKLI